MMRKLMLTLAAVALSFTPVLTLTAVALSLTPTIASAQGGFGGK